MSEIKKYTHVDWRNEAVKRFGHQSENWKFICPSCGYIASVKDWKDVGAPDGAVAFSCVGRWTGSKKEMGDKTGGPCNYTAGGLFNISPVDVKFGDGEMSVFDFAPAAEQEPA